MASFCKGCSIDMFGEDFGDFAYITTNQDWVDDKAAVVLCENCGPIQVNPEGVCISDDCPYHRNKDKQ